MKVRSHVNISKSGTWKSSYGEHGRVPIRKVSSYFQNAHHSAFWNVHFDCCIKVQCAEMKGMEETRMTSVSGLNT